MAFKKIILSVLVLFALAAGFYYGFYKAHYSKKSIQFSASINPNSGSMSTNKVMFEYQLVAPNTSQKGTSFSFGKLTCKFDGYIPISELPSLIINNDPANRKTECVIETDPVLSSRGGYKLYKMLLTYPREAASMDLVNQLGEKLGFKVYSYDTELPWYRAVRNNNPIVFDINTTKGPSYSSNSQDSCIFFNYSMQEILNQFNHKEIPHLGRIEDETGVKGKFNGQIAFSSNLENMKNELASNLGVDLIPFQKKVKYYKVTKR